MNYGFITLNFFVSLQAKRSMTEITQVVNYHRTCGLKGHQHIAQGIALGKKVITESALQGQKLLPRLGDEW